MKKLIFAIVAITTAVGVCAMDDKRRSDIARTMVRMVRLMRSYEVESVTINHEKKTYTVRFTDGVEETRPLKVFES